ncbi:MAG: BamA/TamA family outer membrane protein [Gemmatimonadota bacterium]
MSPFAPSIRRPICLGWIVALAFTGAGRAWAQERPGDTQAIGLVVRGLKFHGNHAYPDEVLTSVIATTASAAFARYGWLRWIGLGERRYLNELDLRRDVLRLTAWYREGGFLEVKVDTVVKRTPRDVWIDFRITEGRPVSVDTFTLRGLDALSSRQRSDLTQDLPIEVGDRFDRRAMLAASDTLIARLRDFGRPSAELFRTFTVDRARRLARIAFEIEPGPPATFGAARITGLVAVDTSVVRRLLAARPGAPFAQRDLYESQRILYRTELFRFAAVDVDTANWTPGGSVVPIEIRVSESKFRRVRTAVGYGTNDCLRAGAGWTARNWLGGGRLLDFSVRASKIGVGSPADWGFERGICPALRRDSIGSALLNYNTTVSLRQPGFLSPFNTQTSALFAERRAEWQVYRREEVGGSFSIHRETPQRIPLTGTYRLAWGRTTAPAITFCAYFNACTAADVAALRERRRLATLSAVVAVPRANDPLDPTRGHNFRFEAAWSDRLLGSSPLTEFTRVQADLAWYRPLSRSITLAWRVRGGLLWSPRSVFDSGTVSFIPPDQRFYAGGPNDVRGYERNQLGPVVYVVKDAFVTAGGEVTDTGQVTLFPSGGNTVAVANVELRLPSPIWSSRIRLAAFVDAGTLFERGKTSLAPALIRVTPGVGLRVATPLGPARVDVGYNPYDRAEGPLYKVETNGDLTLVRDSFSTPRRSRYTFHITIGQAF